MTDTRTALRLGRISPGRIDLIQQIRHVKDGGVYRVVKVGVYHIQRDETGKALAIWVYDLAECAVCNDKILTGRSELPVRVAGEPAWSKKLADLERLAKAGIAHVVGWAPWK